MKIKIANGKTIDVEPEFACSPAYCRGCGKEIIWVRTKNDKRMPVSELGDGSFVSHFFDCPKATKFRKPHESGIKNLQEGNKKA